MTVPPGLNRLFQMALREQQTLDDLWLAAASEHGGETGNLRYLRSPAADPPEVQPFREAWMAARNRTHSLSEQIRLNELEAKGKTV